ncbi:MAG: pyridoxamine 5'-phosphate oxidase family protein [Lachnospiraceae bacterium]|nr:pyridoxamine 5'-phosphate oxidase family protein [Lachnospiraceae bacterium]
MKEAYDFLKKAGTFFLATTEGDQPRVRPFGALADYEGKLYFVTSNVKDVYRQIKADPKVEICAMYDMQWMRIAGELVEDDSRDARVAMLNENPNLSQMYSPDDNKMTVFYIKNAKAVLSSFTSEPVSYEW